MQALADAGEAGMLAGDLTDLFDEPAPRTLRLNAVNRVLAYQRSGQQVRRSAAREPGARRRNASSYRWFITPAGRRRLGVIASSGAAPGGSVAGPARVQLDRTRRRLAAERRKYEALKTAVAELCGPGVPPEARNDRIIALGEAGVDRQLIGDMFRLSRERVRQICGAARKREAAP
jgi:hypothetical protein